MWSRFTIRPVNYLTRQCQQRFRSLLRFITSTTLILNRSQSNVSCKHAVNSVGEIVSLCVTPLITGILFTSLWRIMAAVDRLWGSQYFDIQPQHRATARKQICHYMILTSYFTHVHCFQDIRYSCHYWGMFNFSGLHSLSLTSQLSRLLYRHM